MTVETSELERVARELERMLPCRVRFGEPMARHTTIGAGGKAALFAVPQTAGEVSKLVEFAMEQSLDYIVIGRGSNLLFRDGGYDGLVIKIAGNLAKTRLGVRTAFAEAGASFSNLSRRLTEKGRTGLEFGVGIPGSVGGAVRMNAGAFGGDVAGVLLRVRFIDREGKVRVAAREDIEFGYRQSGLPRGSVILSATFRCPPGRVDRAILRRALGRKRNQPTGGRSFGSTFINPPEAHAARLIEECGLKGRREGGAVISEKHANFILNPVGKARAGDIEELIRLAKREVKRRFGITLKLEVVVVGNK